jgi:hypothetical protein
MPAKGYQCSSRDRGLEMNRTVTDPPIAGCPVRLGKTERLISSNGFIVKDRPDDLHRKG